MPGARLGGSTEHGPLVCGVQAAKRNQKPTRRKKEDNKGEEVLPQQPRILVEKTRGFRRIVSPRMKPKRGQPKLLSPNRSFEPKSGRRGTNIKRRERKKKEITKRGKSGRITRDPLRPPGACESACACYPELSLFMHVKKRKTRERTEEKERKQVSDTKEKRPKISRTTRIHCGVGGSRVVGGVVASSSS